MNVYQALDRLAVSVPNQVEWQVALDYSHLVTSSKLVKIRNFLICFGIYYLSHWIVIPLAFAFGRLTRGIIYQGDFQSAVIAPIVVHLNIALAATLAGALITCLVDSLRPIRWVIVVALLYVFFGFFGYHWAHAPTVQDRIFETVGALFPGVSCFLGGTIASRWRMCSRTPPSPD